MKRFLLLLFAALILAGAGGRRQYDNLALGVPGRADTIVDREGYALGYSELHEQPAWEIYRLTAEEVVLPWVLAQMGRAEILEPESLCLKLLTAIDKIYQWHFSTKELYYG